MREDLKKILLAAHALRDLSVGYPESEVASSQGSGLQNLLSELLVYLHEQGGLTEEDRDLLTGALDHMPDFLPVDPKRLRMERLKALKDDGLTIGECIRVFASAEHGGPDSAYIAAARGLGEDFDMDDDVVVARCDDGGAHVMTWAYISKDHAERAAVDPTGDWVIYHPEEDPEARFWNMEDGWTNLAGATRFSEPPPPLYPMGGPKNTHANIVCIGVMAPYAVQVAEGETEDVDWFECFAESNEHAVEQALNAHPGGKILSAYLTEECPFGNQIDPDAEICGPC